MDKKKIETFGDFCTLIANEPENVWCEDTQMATNCDDDESIRRLIYQFEQSTYYHIPPNKKKTMCQYYDEDDGDTKTFPINMEFKDYAGNWIKIPNSEFEVDE